MQSSGQMHGTITLLASGENVKGVRQICIYLDDSEWPSWLHILDEDVDDIQGYGIDWEDYDDDRIFEHHIALILPTTRR